MAKRSIFDKFLDTLRDAVYDAVVDLGGNTYWSQIPVQPPLPQERPRTARKPRTPHPPRNRRPGPKTPPNPLESTLYDVLEVSPQCSPETLGAAFRSLGKKYHPDTIIGLKGEKEAAAKIREITAAYSILKDPEKRKQYDRSIGLK